MELLRIVRPGGRCFVTVWALEQKRFEGTHEQDVYVDWCLNGRKDRVFKRYYHLFKEGEIDELARQCAPNVQIFRSFFDSDNWCIEYGYATK